MTYPPVLVAFLQAHSSICELVTIGGDCFISNGVVFLNGLFCRRLSGAVLHAQTEEDLFGLPLFNRQ